MPQLYLTDAFRDYFREEKTSGSLNVKFTKSLFLDMLPSKLILQLKRFAYDAFYECISKVNTRVSYPQHISPASRRQLSVF